MKSIILTVFILIIAMLILCISGCEEKKSTIRTIPKGQGSELNGVYKVRDDIEVLVIDSCEYIFYPYGNASWGSHKGNCKNPIHK